MKIFGFKRELLKTKITILGIKFSIRHDYRKKVSANYARKLTELQKEFGKRKIKVGFLVNEPAKWQYQSLYEEIKKSDYFEPVVLVTQLLLAHRGKKHFYATIDDCYNFFKSKGLKVFYVYDKDRKEYIPAKDFGVDILFYQQPWELDVSQHPVNASKSALTCYVPYGLHLVEFNGSYMDNFHQLLWLMFVENNSQIKRFSKLAKSTIFNCIAVGYPKLDAYFSETAPVFSSKKKPLIIYAPHHSFEKDGLNCATFHKNGLDILALAQKYHEYFTWVFKPHPRFKTAVINNSIMSEMEINAYYDEWKKLGQVYNGGDYIGLFKQSDGMITDCISFLGEYLPSGKPLFHLLSENRPFNDFAKTFIDAYYQIENMSQLDTYMEQVILKHQDVKRESRLAKIPVLFDKNEKASTKIIIKLTNSLGGL